MALSISLLVPSLSWAAAKKDPPPTKALTQEAWRGTAQLFQLNFELIHGLLTREAEASFQSPSAQLRVQWNAASVGRLTKAYSFYAEGLTRLFPKHKATWIQIEQRIKWIKTISGAMRNDALSGTKGTTWVKPLKKLGKAKSLLLLMKKAPQQANNKQVEFLLGAISGLGAGAEMLGIFRLRQLVAVIKGSKGKKRKAALDKLQLVFAASVKNKVMFKKLRKMLPTAKWIPLFVYHTALFSVCARFIGKAYAPKAKKAATLLKQYKKRLSQLTASVKRANTSFKHIWRPASSE